MLGFIPGQIDFIGAIDKLVYRAVSGIVSACDSLANSKNFFPAMQQKAFGKTRVAGLIQ